MSFWYVSFCAGVILRSSTLEPKPSIPTTIASTFGPSSLEYSERTASSFCESGGLITLEPKPSVAMSSSTIPCDCSFLICFCSTPITVALRIDLFPLVSSTGIVFVTRLTGLLARFKSFFFAIINSLILIKRLVHFFFFCLSH